MTCSIVIILLLFQGRNDLSADRLCLPAAWMEVAPTWWIHRAGYITFENDALAFTLDFWIWHRNSRKQSLRIRMQGYLIHFFTLSQLHHASQVHHRYPVADVLYDRQV